MTRQPPHDDHPARIAALRTLAVPFKVTAVLVVWTAYYLADRVERIDGGLTVRDLKDGLLWAVGRDE